jgi:hypothetical protein
MEVAATDGEVCRRSVRRLRLMKEKVDEERGILSCYF